MASAFELRFRCSACGCCAALYKPAVVRALPREGVFRSATAWVEPTSAATDAPVRLVVADALTIKSVTVDGTRHVLATDTSAFYALGAACHRFAAGIWGLLGGDEVGRRAGIYILDEYDPTKRPSS